MGIPHSNDSIILSFDNPDTGDWVKMISNKKHNICHGEYDGRNICINLCRSPITPSLMELLIRSLGMTKTNRL